MKKWINSKTLWTNAALLVIYVTDNQMDILPESVKKYLPMVAVLANWYLRSITSTTLSK